MRPYKKPKYKIDIRRFQVNPVRKYTFSNGVKKDEEPTARQIYEEMLRDKLSRLSRTRRKA